MSAQPRGASDRTGSATGVLDGETRPICVRVDQAMQMLGIGKTKIYELFSDGELETIHIGRRTLVLRDSIDRMIERLRRSGRHSS